MRIAHLCLSLGKGGAEKLLVDFMPEYVKKGHEVTIIQLSTILEEPSYIETVEKAGIEVITLSHGGFRKFGYIPAILKLMKSRRFDVFHVHLFPNLYYAAFASLFVKKRPALVWTEHNVTNNRATKKYLHALERFVYGRFDAIIAISPSIELIWKKRFPDLAERILLIRNGVVREKYSEAEPSPDAFFESLGIKKTDYKIFMASRFSGAKDQPTLIKAIALLPENAHCILAGDGDGLQQSVDLISSLGLEKRVHMLGFRTDIPNLMKAADVNVLSSSFEGMSGVTLEALSSGKPFLGSDVPGINDVVPDARFLFEHANERELSEKIMQLLEQPELARQLAQTAVSHTQRFDSKVMIGAHLELYSRLVKN